MQAHALIEKNSWVFRRHHVESNPLTLFDPKGLNAVTQGVKWVMKGAKRLGWIPKGTVPIKTAILMRKAGKDVCIRGGSEAERRRLAKQIEEAANPDGDLIEHGRDAHKYGGNQPYFQSSGSVGHTFYSVAAALTAVNYFGDGFVGNAIDLFNPLSIPKDAMDIYNEFAPEGGQPEACGCEN